MLSETELRFLCEVFERSRIYTTVVPKNELIATIVKQGAEGALGTIPFEEQTIQTSLDATAPRTMYKLTDSFGLCCLYLLLPDTSVPTVLFIGPYLTAPLSDKQLLELGERHGIPPKQQRYLAEYCAGIPVLSPGCHLLIMLTTFCERLWDSPSFAIVDINHQHHVPVSPINQPTHDDFEDILVNMKTMERRYEFENELIQAVALGQLHMESRLLSAFSQEAFEKRVPDPLRNAKNYGVIMNTLLRKAAEKGGVHPVYLDRVSSDFANKIEHLPSLSENTPLMCEMFRTYCRLVRKHTLKHFSLLVQKTILMIDSDLSANLTLHSLAKSQGVSEGYLSTIFKKETGENVSRYIQEKRIRHATHLLDTTDLQIQTVALHCGILDVQYFSKIFKQHVGLTPKEYRRRSKGHSEA